MPNYNVDNVSYNDSTDEYTLSTELGYEDEIYNSDEYSSTRFNIALCELYNEKLHGNTLSDVKYNYLLHTRFKQLNMNCINEFADFLNNSYSSSFNYQDNLHHNIFRNYRNMVVTGNYIKPEIVEVLYLKNNEGFSDYCISIIKTVWLKIIQRTWKNIYKKRQEIIFKRKQISSLLCREINGRWPDNCMQYPGLRGMLSRRNT
jgi:hypothetical protein